MPPDHPTCPNCARHREAYAALLRGVCRLKKAMEEYEADDAEMYPEAVLDEADGLIDLAGFEKEIRS